MTPEEQLIHRYFDAFNRHDFEGRRRAFTSNRAIIGATGKRCAGRAEVRRSYESEFAMFLDGHCELRLCTGNSGRGVAELCSAKIRVSARTISCEGHTPAQGLDQVSRESIAPRSEGPARVSMSGF